GARVAHHVLARRGVAPRLEHLERDGALEVLDEERGGHSEPPRETCAHGIGSCLVRPLLDPQHLQAPEARTPSELFVRPAHCPAREKHAVPLGGLPVGLHSRLTGHVRKLTCKSDRCNRTMSNVSLDTYRKSEHRADNAHRKSGSDSWGARA